MTAVHSFTVSLVCPVDVYSNDRLLACIHVDVISTARTPIDICRVCVCLTDNTRGAGELFPDTGGPGVGVPASPQGPGHSSALRCSS